MDEEDERYAMKAIGELEKAGKKTIGFAVSGSPVWLFKELVLESKEFYNDVYWPVLVGWWRDAMTLRQLRNEQSVYKEVKEEVEGGSEKAEGIGGKEVKVRVLGSG